MDVMGTIEKGFGKVNATVFRQVNRVTDWWHLPTPIALLNLRGLRDDLRESNLFDTRPPTTVPRRPPTGSPSTAPTTARSRTRPTPTWAGQAPGSVATRRPR